MDALLGIVFGAVLVEAIVTALKPIWDESKRQISFGAVMSLIVGLGIAFATGIDLCAAAGFPVLVPVVPQLITGILISRGSNYIYDILSQIKDSVIKQTSQSTIDEP
jgi:formate-dependent nitrite reductase membrane component NrfD